MKQRYMEKNNTKRMFSFINGIMKQSNTFFLFFKYSLVKVSYMVLIIRTKIPYTSVLATASGALQVLPVSPVCSSIFSPSPSSFALSASHLSLISLASSFKSGPTVLLSHPLALSSGPVVPTSCS